MTYDELLKLGIAMQELSDRDYVWIFDDKLDKMNKEYIRFILSRETAYTSQGTLDS